MDQDVEQEEPRQTEEESDVEVTNDNRIFPIARLEEQLKNIFKPRLRVCSESSKWKYKDCEYVETFGIADSEGSDCEVAECPTAQ